MKNNADDLAAAMHVQRAIQEYGQLLKHPYFFSEMPIEERYDGRLSRSNFHL